ncbi:MAG TPA: HDOD domain-containing protein [Bryobacteraceae bacterium]|nr:HDOD domain-containing protein [Bryobacteraceae bacterium]
MTASATKLPVRDRALHVLGELPPFSPILNRLMASLAAEDVSFAKVADLIEKDTVVAGNILKLVNSALYSLSGTVNSVRRAVSLLGVNKVRNVTLSMSVSRMWKQVKTPPGWSMGSFNLRAAGVAILADVLAQNLAVDYAEGAFAAGLFHDLGQLLVALGCPEEFKQVSLLCKPGAKWAAEYELEILGISHADLSAAALAVWNLPRPIQDAVRFHETPEQDPAAKHGRIVLSRIVNVADQYFDQIETCATTFDSGDANAPGFPDPLQLGDRLPAVLSRFENELAAIKPYF